MIATLPAGLGRGEVDADGWGMKKKRELGVRGGLSSGKWVARGGVTWRGV
jgi:hypothetical protein